MFDFLDGIAEHWALIGAVLTINALVSIAKRVARMLKASDGVAWLVAHVSPILLGVGLAAIPGVSVQHVEGFAARAFFFVSCGLGSSWLYRLAKQFAKKRGYSLESEAPQE